MEIMSRIRRKIPENAFVADELYVSQNLAHLPVFAQHASERADEYWNKQRREIWNRISAREERTTQVSPRLLWGALAVIATFAMLLLFQGSEPQKQVHTQSDLDHELLLAVERAVQLDGPEALEPAALLAREIGRNQQGHSTDKGNQNHED
jgi:hypothetical protein